MFAAATAPLVTALEQTDELVSVPAAGPAHAAVQTQEDPSRSRATAPLGELVG
jgi:hypothetical protein